MVVAKNERQCRNEGECMRVQRQKKRETFERQTKINVVLVVVVRRRTGGLNDSMLHAQLHDANYTSLGTCHGSFVDMKLKKS